MIGCMHGYLPISGSYCDERYPPNPQNWVLTARGPEKNLGGELTVGAKSGSRRSPCHAPT